jgi:flagellar basal body-associated protein FliL
MSEDDQDTSADESKKAKKSKKPILLILAVVVLVGAAAAAGIFLGPALAGSNKPAAAGAAGPEAHGDEEPNEGEEGHEAPGSVSIDPIVVDVKDAEGVLHHLKVTLSFELRKGVADGDFRPFVPRGREAAIAYLRSESFENLTAADRFAEVREELAKRVLMAVGEKKAGRVLITDFVAQ